jgi:hypothetical protein
MLFDTVINEISRDVNPKLKHNDTVCQIEQVFRKNGFYTTKEYPIYKLKDGSDRAGRIDLVARKDKFRVAVEYAHHKLIKWKSFQKIIQIKPDVAIAIAGSGLLESNMMRAIKFRAIVRYPLYVVSLRDKNYKILKGPEVF